MQGTEDQNIETSFQLLGWCPVFRGGWQEPAVWPRQLATTDSQRGVDNADAPLRVRGVDVADAPLRVRSVDVAVALLREMRDAATSGIAETSESDVPLACAATLSRSRRNDVDEEDGCRDSVSETTPQRLW